MNNKKIIKDIELKINQGKLDEAISDLQVETIPDLTKKFNNS